MSYRPKVYIASKLHHAPLWRNLRERHPEIEFTSRWIDNEDCAEAKAGPAEFAHFWTIDIQDVKRSDFVLLYAGRWTETPDVLKGALIEAGAMLAFGGTVLAVGLPTSHSWSYHPRVVRLLSLEEVFDFLKRYYIIPQRKVEPELVPDLRLYEGK